MRHNALGLGFLWFFLFTSVPATFAQAIGEYGRTVGGIRQRQDTVIPKPRDGGSSNLRGKGSTEGVGDLGVQSIRGQLFVASKKAVLYSRQDDETDKLDELSLGDPLIPLMHASGGNVEWYMVKTTKGLVGWIKSSDVREQAAKMR